jgi:integration host factor subunit alpha
MYYKRLLQYEEASVTLTKAHLSKKIGDAPGFMKGQAAEILENMLEIMKKGLIAGESVMISGFGEWQVKSNHVRRGRNLKTGEHIILNVRKA